MQSLNPKNLGLNIVCKFSSSVDIAQGKGSSSKLSGERRGSCRVHVERNTFSLCFASSGVENYVVNWFSKRDDLSLSHFPFTTCAETSLIPSRSPAQTHNSLGLYTHTAKYNSWRIEMQISAGRWRKEFVPTINSVQKIDVVFLSDTSEELKHRFHSRARLIFHNLFWAAHV